MRVRDVAAVAAVLLLATSCSSGSGGRHTVSSSPPASVPATGPASGATSGTTAPATPAELDVRAENAKPGTTAWRIPTAVLGTVSEVSGYADRTSILSGQTFRLFASTTSTSLRAVAYRMGYYQGTGGRQVWASGALTARRQTAQTFIAGTRTLVERWQATTTVTADAWAPGVYLIKLTAGTGSLARSRYVPMVVRSRSTAGRTVIMPSTFTWQAYNDFGGRSAYHGPDGTFASRAYAVSFLRPNTWGAGTGKFLSYERPVIKLAEQLGLPLAYESDFDLTTVPGVLSQARAVVVMGHAEYWSVPQRDAVETARDHGTNLLFLGANTSYWRIRLASSDHTMVIYKSTADPVYPAADTTNLWRGAPHPRPERRLTGQAYNCFPATGTFRVVAPGFWGFAGTGVTAGTTFAGIVGVEIDHAVLGSDVPRPLEVVASSPASCGKQATLSSMTYYTNTAGAGVVTTGSMAWVLDGFTSRVPARSLAFVVRVTSNLLREAARGKLGALHPAADNLGRYADPAG